MGRLLAPVLMLTLGLALLISGRRRRRVAEATGAATRGPRARVAVGVLLVFLSTFGTAAAQMSKQRELQSTSVALPQSLLGLDRDDSMLGSKRTAMLSSLADQLDLTDVGAYGDGAPLLIVAAGRGRFEDPEAELARAFPRSSFPATIEIDAGRTVPAGDLGGSARCWTAESFGTGADICGFVSATSIVLVIDRLAPDSAAAALRALAIRQSVITVEGQHPSDVALPRVAPGPTIRVSLPASVNGWQKKQTAAFAGPRTEFITGAKASGLREADMGVYLVDDRGVMVQTALGRFRNAEIATRGFAKELGTQTDRPPGRAVPVSNGSTAVTCWMVQIDGPAVACLKVDAQAFVAVYDLGSTSIARSAAITRTFAAAVERRA
jgi:hypothetical protein